MSDNPRWPKLEQDWAEPPVRVFDATYSPSKTIVPPGVFEQSEPIKIESEHSKTRASILTKAAGHISQALIELNEAVAWFSIVDPKDQSEIVRRVEQLADTIEYRRSL